MYEVNDRFFENIPKYGRQFDLQTELVGQNKTLTVYDINVFTHRFNCSLFQSVMRAIEIDSNEVIKAQTILNSKLGIKNNNDNYDYINYSNYKTLADSEYNEDTKAYITLAYDKMHEAMIDYDLNLLEKIKVRDFIIKICQRLGWDTKNIPSVFVNSEKYIDPTLYMGIGYTFRNVLDEMAKITCSFPCFGLDGLFTLKYITETGKTINNDYLSEDNLTFTKEYYINSVVFARAEDSDTFYKRDEEDIAKNGLHEYKLSDLQVLSMDNRSDFIDEIYQYLRALKFWIFDIKTTGVFIFDIADRFTVQLDNKSYSVVLLNSEGIVEQGLTEQMYVDEPEETETDYKSSTSDKLLDVQVKITVNKHTKEINQLVQESSEHEDKLVQHEQDINGLRQTVSNTAEYKRTVEGVTQIHISDAEEAEILKLEIKGNKTYESNLYPGEDLFPGEDVYPNMGRCDV